LTGRAALLLERRPPYHQRSGVQHYGRWLKYLILARYFDRHSRSRCPVLRSFQITPVKAKLRHAGHLNGVVRSHFGRSRKWKSGRAVCHLPLDEKADCNCKCGRNYPAGYVHDSQNSCTSCQTLSRSWCVISLQLLRSGYWLAFVLILRFVRKPLVRTIALPRQKEQPENDNHPEDCDPVQ
jgi:hypothetical protein